MRFEALSPRCVAQLEGETQNDFSKTICYLGRVLCSPSIEDEHQMP